MSSPEDSECHVWWHPGPGRWAWLCWRRGTPGAGWNSSEEAWRPAYEAAIEHMRTDHRSRIQPDLLPLLNDDDPLGVDELATHRLPLDQAPQADEMFQQKRDGAVKILLTS